MSPSVASCRATGPQAEAMVCCVVLAGKRVAAATAVPAVIRRKDASNRTIDRHLTLCLLRGQDHSRRQRALHTLGRGSLSFFNSFLTVLK